MKPILLLLLALVHCFAAPEIHLSPGDDVQAALNRAEGGVVTLAPGIYETSIFYVVPPRCKLQGSGMTRTIIKKHGMYSAIQNRQEAGADWIEISDLSIDCCEESFMGVCLFGSHNVVRN